jgi:hypothetical protein
MWSRGGVSAVGLALAVASCASPGPMALDGVTIMRHGYMGEGPAALLERATIVFRDGCVGTDVLPTGNFEPIIWPPGARLSHQGDDVVLVVDGLVIHHLDAANVGGGEYNDVAFIERLSGAIPEACRADRYWLATEVLAPGS